MTFLGLDVDPITWAFSVMFTVIIILGIMEKIMGSDEDE